MKSVILGSSFPLAVPLQPFNYDIQKSGESVKWLAAVEASNTPSQSEPKVSIVFSTDSNRLGSGNQRKRSFRCDSNVAGS